jgi:hypothetical protein
MFRSCTTFRSRVSEHSNLRGHIELVLLAAHDVMHHTGRMRPQEPLVSQCWRGLCVGARCKGL